MEAQMSTGGSDGTGFDVPEQGLHLRTMGLDTVGRTVRGGALDTSMGPIAVEMLDDAVHGWSDGRERTPVETPADDVDERIVAVPEQFVRLLGDKGALRGMLRTEAGDVHVTERDGVVTMGAGAE